MIVFRLLLTLSLISFWSVSFAQVFPGDANNNGQVNNVDILYMGHAFGAFGPARIDDGTTFEPQEISILWENNFPDGLNYIYADANGNGLVEVTDFITVFLNYGSEQEMVIPEEYPQGNLGVDPAFDFEINGIPGNLTAGDIVTVPIQLGSEDRPLIDCNGIAFVVEYDSEILQNVELNLTTSFLNADQQAFPLLYEYEEGEIDVGITRYGKAPVSGWGNIGVLSMIIEENLIDFLPDDIDSIGVVIRIKNIMALDTTQQPILIASDSIEIMVYHPDALVHSNESDPSTGVTIFPNPSPGKVYIATPDPIQEIQITDARGARLATINGKGSKKMQLNTTGLPGGLLLLQIHTSKGVMTRKLFKHK
ncbi:MAG: hypothetical protein DHS20C18_19850 [Saprospiraceae bacterium]|nr:MAG: hypothetical protein DHS20C18_19850 [Saprospiraceae bacterium]